MSQAELADAIGQLRASVSNIEAGRQKAPLHVLYLISQALGTELKEILPDRFEASDEDTGLSLKSSVELFGEKHPEIDKGLRQDYRELKRMIAG